MGKVLFVPNSSYLFSAGTIIINLYTFHNSFIKKL